MVIETRSNGSSPTKPARENKNKRKEKETRQHFVRVFIKLDQTRLELLKKRKKERAWVQKKPCRIVRETYEISSFPCLKTVSVGVAEFCLIKRIVNLVPCVILAKVGTAQITGKRTCVSPTQKKSRKKIETFSVQNFFVSSGVLDPSLNFFFFSPTFFIEW